MKVIRKRRRFALPVQLLIAAAIAGLCFLGGLYSARALAGSTLGQAAMPAQGAEE